MSKENLLQKIGIANIIILMGIAVLGFILLRFLFLPEPQNTHFHANFQIWLNGERVPFDDNRFYEGIVACDTQNYKEPGFRTHLHQPDNDVVHVHADAVSWGHFFEVLGYDVSDQAIVTPNRVLQEDAINSITFILNGKETGSIANKVITSEDSLLVNYGTESVPELNARWRDISQTAGEFNEVDDPATCSGDSQQDWRERLQKAVWN